ncbi:MAG: leucine-rich repeat domain-containing protein [Muribaculaceae bacterium]|nr:leucine-rich repeat domain-containing protein [Muribaculaceae bacterium]
MKNILAAALCIATAASAWALKPAHFEAGGIHYWVNEYEENTVSVGNSESCWEEWEIDIFDCLPWSCDKGNDYAGDVVIPRTVTHQGREYTVTRIAVAAFTNCSNLTSVKMPETIDYVGEGAFYRCSKLHTIEFSNRVRGIHFNTLFECTALEKLNLRGLQDFVELNLRRCPNLKEVILPENAIYYYLDGDNKDCRYIIHNPVPPRGVKVEIKNMGSGSVLCFPEPGFYPESAQWGRSYFPKYEEFDAAGIEDVTVTEPSGIKVNGNTVCAPLSASVEAYDAQGRLCSVVPAGGSQALAPGVYLLKCGSATEKVAL